MVEINKMKKEQEKNREIQYFALKRRNEKRDIVRFSKMSRSRGHLTDCSNVLVFLEPGPDGQKIPSRWKP
jgi:hypothetical protein